ncbi:BlaI/MecI/CopY family transcriptional regulator [Nostoc sp. UIC 10890]
MYFTDKKMMQGFVFRSPEVELGAGGSSDSLGKKAETVLSGEEAFDQIQRKEKGWRHERLSKQEEEAMLAVWKVGRGFIKDYLEKMGEPQPHYNTFTSTIKNLEKKGFLTGKRVGLMYAYEPLVSEEEYKQRFLSNVVQDYFKNSYKEMVAFFAKEQQISAEELEEILKMIKDGRS